MKRIDTSNIVPGVRGLGASKQTLDHLQQAFTEVFVDLFKALMQDPSAVTVLHGCYDTDNTSVYDITEGAVFYNGEVFRVPALEASPSGGDVLVLVEDNSYIESDPAVYSDGNEFNTHQIRALKWELGASGSGIVDFENLNRLQKTKTVEIGDWDMDTNADVQVSHGLDRRYIRGVQVIVRTDAGEGGGNYYNLNMVQSTSQNVNGGVSAIGSSDITIDRCTGGFFDSTNFNSTGYNRGWVTITYV